MDFRLSEEQQMLQDTVARLVRAEYSFEQRMAHSASALGFSEAFWRRLGELGLTAVPFPEAVGGFGGTGVEVMTVMTELGRGLCLEPYLQSVVLGGGLIQQVDVVIVPVKIIPHFLVGQRRQVRCVLLTVEAADQLLVFLLQT